MKRILIAAAIVLLFAGSGFAQCPDGQRLFEWNGYYKCLYVPLRVDGNWNAVPKACWEYKTEWYNEWGQSQLNQFGADGWEHYFVVSKNRAGFINYFKRPVPCKE